LRPPREECQAASQSNSSLPIRQNPPPTFGNNMVATESCLFRKCVSLRFAHRDKSNWFPPHHFAVEES